MTIYEGTPKRPYFSCKFVRVNDVIAITDPEDTKTNHKSLAQEDGLLKEFKRLKQSSPTDVDAGTALFAKLSRNYPTIILKGSSSTLELSQNSTARTKTVEIFSAKTPGYRIKSI
jgi:hypothetical protein